MKQPGLLDQLYLFPQIAPHVQTETMGNRCIIVFPRFRNKWMQKYLVPRNRSPLIRVRLDDHGSAVWQKIDGRRTVYDIVESLASHFDGDDKYELQISIFINHLRQEGYIRMLSEPAP